MKARPILFSAPMVRALLDGRKSQTRRVIKPQPVIDGGWEGPPDWALFWKENEDGCTPEEMARLCPYGKPRDLLWVRETWAPSVEPENHAHARIGFTYRADWDCDDDTHLRDFRWKPSLHMPRIASRLTLEITDVRVERLQDISDADKAAEGGTRDKPFGTVWRAINTAPDIRWDDNPWVWVLEFKVHRCNVDELLKARAT